MGLTNSETNYNSDESTGSCEGNPSNTDPNTYFKNLDLQLFVEEPLAMLCSFRTFRNECLSTGNPKAHYIEGLLQYFQHRRSIRGLKHLRQSADANYDYGVYIYSILMLCRGNFSEGKKYLDRLSWKANQARTVQCLTMVKNSKRNQSRFEDQIFNKYRLNGAPNKLRQSWHGQWMRKFLLL